MVALAEAAVAQDFLRRCEADADFFSRQLIGRRRWARQLEMRRSIWEHRRTHVRSANGVGKTFDLGSVVCEWLITNPGGRVVCTGPTFEQVRGGLWHEVRKAYYSAEGNGVPLGGRMGQHDWVLDDGWDAAVMSVDNISAIQGRRGSKVLIVVDEAQGVTSGDLWDALESLMTATDSRIVASGNPLVPSGRFFEYASQPEWHTIRIDGLEHPNVVSGREIFPGAITREWVEERRRTWGEDDPRWVARVRGQFPTEGTSQVITLAMLEEAAAGTVGVEKESRRIGLDVARYGDDASVLVVLDEARNVIHVDSWRKQDLMSTAGRCKLAMERFRVSPQSVNVDVVGMGAAVVDALHEQGLAVQGVDFGSAPGGEWAELVGRDAKFVNRRSELHWVVRELLRQRAISIPNESQYRPIWSDLMVPLYDYDAQGRIAVERKDSIKKRIGRSPDFGDAVVLAVAGRRRRVAGLTVVNMADDEEDDE